MDKNRELDLRELEKRIRYTFRQPALLDAALTHTSYVKGDGKGTAHNERLEFLGDAVLELLVSERIYALYPHWSEGAMTRARADVVCEAALLNMAQRRFRLSEFLLLGNGEEWTGGRRKPSIISDAFEALTGAIYLDGGMEAARAFVADCTEAALSDLRAPKKDAKTALQERIQKRRLGKLEYRLAGASGPEHKKLFTMRVYLNDRCLGEGAGASKQEAGREAARQALLHWEADGETPPAAETANP